MAQVAEVSGFTRDVVIDDELWAEVEPLIPHRPRRTRHTGRKPLPDRVVLNGILHVLRTGIAWEDLPQELGYGSGVTCWRRLRDWQREGAWDMLLERLQCGLDAGAAIDWSRTVRSQRPRVLL
jgi:transposase